MADFKQRLCDYYKEKIIARAKALAKENKEKKESDERKMREAETEMNAKWTFKGVSRVAGTGPAPVQVTPAKEEVPTSGWIKIGKKAETQPSEVKTDAKDVKPSPWARKKVDE